MESSANLYCFVALISCWRLGTKDQYIYICIQYLVLGGTKHKQTVEQVSSCHFCWEKVLRETQKQSLISLDKISGRYFQVPLFSVELYQILFQHFHFRRKLEHIRGDTGLVKLMMFYLRHESQVVLQSQPNFLFSSVPQLIFNSYFCHREIEKKVWLTVLSRHLTDIGIQN